ncbi:MAG: sulfur carrier protein ThiS [Phycisphaeraceae bacterium]
MQLIVNGQHCTLEKSDATVTDLVAHLKLTGRPAAVEVNRTLVPKRRHADHVLHEGDTIEVVTLVGGG